MTTTTTTPMDTERGGASRRRRRVGDTSCHNNPYIIFLVLVAVFVSGMVTMNIWFTVMQQQQQEATSNKFVKRNYLRDALESFTMVDSTSSLLSNPMTIFEEEDEAEAEEETMNMEHDDDNRRSNVNRHHNNEEEEEEGNEDDNEDEDDGTHKLAGLSCDAYNKGSPDNVYVQQEMVYWEDIPSDSNYKSPFYSPEKYVTFEPDKGGWNNIRMAMETIVVMAHAMGRTLVLPPTQKMYLLDKGEDSKFGFADFFHLDSLDNEHEGLSIISMEEFLTREGLTGHLLDSSTKQPLLPPNNQVNYDGQERKGDNPLWNYLRNVGHVRTEWHPGNCVAAFPATTNPQDIEELNKMISQMKSSWPQPEDFTNQPPKVNASSYERLREVMGGGERKDICIYDQEMQNQLLIHFQVNKEENSRLLTHFYAFVYFQSWTQDLFYKRFVRDHLRYMDELQCAAATVIQAIRQTAREHNSSNAGKQGDYDAMHIRRGDFQYKKTRISVHDIYEFSKDELEEGSTLYIATDERDKLFFAPLKEYYNVVYLDDYLHLIPNLNTNLYGMLDQLICTKSRHFFGTWWSTFSGYINRMRGYHANRLQSPGYDQGIVQSWYFVPEERKYEMQQYKAVRQPIYMREFPTSWRFIDEGIQELHSSTDITTIT